MYGSAFSYHTENIGVKYILEWYSLKQNIMADGRVVETENLKKVLDTISKIKKKKEGQYEEKVVQVCVEEFDLNKEEVLTSLKKAVDDRMLKIVNKNNKTSYRIVQETHLDGDYVIDSQIHGTLETTDVAKDLQIRLDKTSHDDLTKLANEFRSFKAEIQQQITSLREHFLEIQKNAYLPKSAPSLDFDPLPYRGKKPGKSD